MTELKVGSYYYYEYISTADPIILKVINTCKQGYIVSIEGRYINGEVTLFMKDVKYCRLAVEYYLDLEFKEYIED